jgi:hypothetical protein
MNLPVLQEIRVLLKKEIIPNLICHGLFYVQWFEVRDDCSFCSPSLFKVSLHIFFNHSPMDMCYFITVPVSYKTPLYLSSQYHEAFLLYSFKIISWIYLYSKKFVFFWKKKSNTFFHLHISWQLFHWRFVVSLVSMIWGQRWLFILFTITV